MPEPVPPVVPETVCVWAPLLVVVIVVEPPVVCMVVTTSGVSVAEIEFLLCVNVCVCAPSDDVVPLKLCV